MYNRKLILIMYGLIFILSFVLSGCGLVSTSNIQAGPIQTPEEASTDNLNLEPTVLTPQTQADAIDPIASAAAFATKQEEDRSQQALDDDQTQEKEASPSPTQERTRPNGETIPQDVPYPGSYVSDFHSSRNFISFSTSYDITPLAQYYMENMQEFGWMLVETGTYISETDAQLVFNKPERKSTVLFRQNPLS